MQYYDRLYGYISEYLQLVYKTYSTHAIAYLCTYYNLDKDETVWDKTDLFGGAYEPIGEYSGITWNKYLLIPVFYVEEMQVSFDAAEEGLIKEADTSIIIPSTYGIQPYTHDIVKFEQSFLRSENDIYPLYHVTGIEKSTNTDYVFWKLRLKVFQSLTLDDIEDQINDTYSFVEFTKKIYSTDDASSISKMLYKANIIRDRLDGLFDHNTGFYLV